MFPVYFKGSDESKKAYRTLPAKVRELLMHENRKNRNRCQAFEGTNPKECSCFKLRNSSLKKSLAF
jgi:hypothetical protein